MFGTLDRINVHNITPEAPAGNRPLLPQFTRFVGAVTCFESYLADLIAYKLQCPSELREIKPTMRDEDWERIANEVAGSYNYALLYKVLYEASRNPAVVAPLYDMIAGKFPSFFEPCNYRTEMILLALIKSTVWPEKSRESLNSVEHYTICDAPVNSLVMSNISTERIIPDQLALILLTLKTDKELACARLLNIKSPQFWDDEGKNFNRDFAESNLLNLLIEIELQGNEFNEQQPCLPDLRRF